MALDPKKPEDLAELRRLAGIWKAQDGLPGPDVNRVLDAAPALVDLVDEAFDASRAVVLIRCIGCGTPLGSQVPSQGAIDHVRTCAGHPLAAELASLREQLAAARANHAQAMQDLGAEQAAVAQLRAERDAARAAAANMRCP